MAAVSGQLRFFDLADIDRILMELNVNLEDVEAKECVICKRRLKKEDIGAFKSGSVEPICKEFSCIMTALLEEKTRVE